MEEIGQARSTLVPALAFAVAVLGSAWAWPFAIDDAWISVRYARHLAAGAGYVWNLGGPSTDGVTPLPWPFLLAPLAHGAPATVVLRAKALGAMSWIATASALGVGMGRAQAPLWTKIAAVAVLALDVPVAAHAVSGMETALATALATAAVLSHRRPLVASLLAGLAASLRPELVVWAITLAAGLAITCPTQAKARPFVAGAIAIGPFLSCALVRELAFGRFAPLSLLAKPSDLRHGIAYAGAAVVFALAPLTLLCPFALARERGPALSVVFAAIVHVLVIVAVGGYWMPYARLMVPVVPGMLFAFVLVSGRGAVGWTAVRVAAALLTGLVLFPTNVRALRQAGHDREAMIAAAAPLLRSPGRIAAVDIGWVSAISEGPIFDLAGVTDPEVAVLGGGHTSKHVDTALLLAHDPSTVLFYSDRLPEAEESRGPGAFPRVVEARLASSEAFMARFAPAAVVPLGRSGAGYVIFRRR